MDKIIYRVANCDMSFLTYDMNFEYESPESIWFYTSRDAFKWLASKGLDKSLVVVARMLTKRQVLELGNEVQI